MLNQKKTSMEAKIRHDIQKVSDASLTHDGWTSVATDSYSAITGHFIDSQWNLKSVVLQIKKVDGPHTACKIAEDLTGKKILIQNNRSSSFTCRICVCVDCIISNYKIKLNTTCSFAFLRKIIKENGVL
jgi:hypothetical protein